MKQLIAMMLALSILLNCAMAETSAQYIVETGDSAALVDGDGTTILSDDGIERIFVINEAGLYAAGREGDYGLYDAGGALMTTERFSMIDDMGDALIYRQGGLYGAMNLTGGVLLLPEWTQLVSNGGGGFLALRTDPEDGEPDEIIYIALGEEPVSTDCKTGSGLVEMREGRMPFMDEKGRFGCVDALGRVVIDCALDWIGDFHEGAAIASLAGRYGLIDAAGAWTVEPEYDWMDRGGVFIAALKLGERLDVYDNDGRLLYSVHTNGRRAAIVGEYVVLTEMDAVRVYNARGRCILETAADALVLPGAGSQLILSQGLWGEAGESIIGPDGVAVQGQWQHLTPLCEDRYAFMTMQGVEYNSDDLGGPQMSWDYDSVRYGLLDGSGAARLPAEYREIRALGDDRLLLVTDEAVSFADLNGRVLRSWTVVTATTASISAGG